MRKGSLRWDGLKNRQQQVQNTGILRLHGSQDAVSHFAQDDDVKQITANNNSKTDNNSNNKTDNCAKNWSKRNRNETSFDCGC
jgi:hypothetical protein